MTNQVAVAPEYGTLSARVNRLGTFRAAPEKAVKTNTEPFGTAKSRVITGLHGC